MKEVVKVGHMCAGGAEGSKTPDVLEYNILRGRNKIGENLVEISCGETRLLVELGKALDGGDGLSELERIVLDAHYDAVVISHYHADHAGLVPFKHDCPIFVGGGAKRVLRAMREYHGQTLGDNVVAFESGKPFSIGKIKITPFLCDHSAFDSYMLLFEANGKKILYTGDFRFHGRKPKDAWLSRLPKEVDTLIHEGTNLGNSKRIISEQELETRFADVMRRSDKPVFVFQSGTNIDRLVTVYRASKRSGRALYEDNYAALVASACGGKIPRPDVFPDVFAFTPRRLVGARADMFCEFEQKLGFGGIVARGARFTMLVRPSMLGYIRKLGRAFDLCGATLVYSMWSGYKDRDDVAEFLREAEELGMTVVDLHTSGHASADDIELLKRRVHAKEYVVIHNS